jgi:hypothetical protein
LFRPCFSRNSVTQGGRAILQPTTSDEEENAVTRITTRFTGRAAISAAVALGTLIVLVTEAAAVSARVQSACASDYFAYCSQHDPDGPGVRKCMRANGPRLSSACVNALIAAGEVSKQEVTRRAAAK